MKTIKLKLVLSILLITFCTISFASVNEPSEETATMSKSRLSEIITSQIDFPDALANDIQEGFVIVSISFDSTGQLKIDEVNASNKSLQKYVTTQLEKIIIINSNKTIGSQMNYQFNFRKNQ